MIEPFVIDQRYVAPAPASATLAVLPLDDAQAVPPVVIVATGRGLKTTVVEAVGLPKHGFVLVTVTV